MRDLLQCRQKPVCLLAGELGQAGFKCPKTTRAWLGLLEPYPLFTVTRLGGYLQQCHTNLHEFLIEKIKN